MNNLFYTPEQFRVFSQDLLGVFVKSGFELFEEPYIDYGLWGFRATYIRRYLLHQPTSLYDGIMTTLIHVIGLPFGHQSHKMVILSAPKNIKNEPISDTLKLRIHFDQSGNPQVVQADQQPAANFDPTLTNATNNLFASQSSSENKSNQHQQEHDCNTNHSLTEQLKRYVAQIVEAISPGLIGLPTEMKLEILKKLSVESIIRMSQVNNEFRYLIFRRGEPLWRHLCHRDFKIKAINRLVHKSWMDLYRDSYIIHQNQLCRKERALPGLPERPALPPTPNLLQIGWLPEVLDVPFIPIDAEIDHHHDPLRFALEWFPLRRGNSLESLH